MEATATIHPTDPAAVEWRHAPGESIAHAFTEGRGWMRSRCRRIPLTIALVDALPDMPRCDACLAIVEPTTGELAQLWGK